MLKATGIGAAAALLPATHAHGAREPATQRSKALNVVWIFCDELRTEALGCYGSRRYRARTPNIDALAAGGVRFTNHFCNSPVCVPSRVATLTGRYPEETGVYNNEAAWSSFRQPATHVTFPQAFAGQGYATANFGKVHVAHAMYPGHTRGYDLFKVHNPEGSEMQYWSPLGEKAVGMIRSPNGGMQGGAYPDDHPYPPDMVVTNGLAWLDKQRAKAASPFFIRFSILQPHTPVLPPRRVLDAFRDIDYGLPGKLPDTISTFEKRVAKVHGLERMKPEALREARRCYFAQVGWVDEQVGRVMNYLREHNLLDNTLVIFGADHGTPNGDTGAFEKHTFAPCVHRVPLIVSLPGRLTPGQVREDISDSLDVGRTAMAAAGVAAPDGFRGRDLFNSQPPEAIFATIGYGEVGSKMGPNGGHGDWLDGRGWPRRTCVRTARHRLDMNVRIDGKPVPDADRDIFLADVVSDPDETVNLGGDPKHADTVRTLRGMIEAHGKNAVEMPPDFVRKPSRSKTKDED